MKNSVEKHMYGITLYPVEYVKSNHPRQYIIAEPTQLCTYLLHMIMVAVRHFSYDKCKMLTWYLQLPYSKVSLPFNNLNIFKDLKNENCFRFSLS